MGLFKNQKGFTLAEMLVVAPIMILTGMILLGTMIDKNGEMYERSSRLNLQIEGQRLLQQMQDELFFASRFNQTLDTELTDSYQPGGGWNYNTSPNATLIISEIALDSYREDDDRTPVFYVSGPYVGDLAYNNLIYFVSGTTLFRRTVSPPSANVSPANFKKTTCPAGTANCPDDAPVSTKVQVFTVQYFDADDVSAGSDPTTAEKVKVSLTLTDQANGKTITESMSLTMKKLNSI